MSIKTLLTPFSQKYILQKGRLENQPSLDFIYPIGWDINWYWSKPNTRVISEIIRDFDHLTEGEFELYSSDSDSDCIVSNQPVWDMKEVMARHESEWSEPSSFDGLLESTSCKGWRMEQLAYYVPAHSGSADLYGIHLTKRGIARLAKEVHALCPEQPLEVIVAAAAYKLYAHEICHAWVEDVVCLFDFSRGASGSLSSRIYQQTAERYNHYIFMEEALCNTAAHGWLHQFLFERSGKRDAAMPAFDERRVLCAFAEWMRNQPRGYCDFLAIEQRPQHSEKFMQNFARLLTEIYQLSSYGSLGRRRTRDGLELVCVTEPLGIYFGGHLFSGGMRYNSIEQEFWHTLSSGEPPLHVELGGEKLTQRASEECEILV